MRRLTAFVMISLALPAAAQQTDRGDGTWVNAHYTQASGSTMDIAIPFQTYTLETSSGSGGGFGLGYGFLPWLSAYMNVDVAGGQTVTATGATITATQTLYQVDAGARLQLPLHGVPITPYALLAYSSRLLSGEASVSPSGPGTLSEWGGAFTYGAGVEWFFARHFALDVSYARSQGAYSKIQVTNGANFETGAGSSGTSRFQAGATWRAGPMPPPPSPIVPNMDTLTTGQQVRVHAGSKIVSGSVIFLDRDTVVLQRMVKDAAVQSAIPRACIVSAHQLIPPSPVGPKLVTGTVLGAIAGSLVGTIVSAQSSSPPKKTGPFVLTYTASGALLGLATAAIVDKVQGEQWVPLRTPNDSKLSFEARNEVCASWN